MCTLAGSNQLSTLGWQQLLLLGGFGAQPASIVHASIGMEAEAALERPARVVVLHAVCVEGPYFSAVA